MVVFNAEEDNPQLSPHPSEEAARQVTFAPVYVKSNALMAERS